MMSHAVKITPIPYNMISLREDKQAAKDKLVPWMLLSVLPAALYIYLVIYG